VVALHPAPNLALVLLLAPFVAAAARLPVVAHVPCAVVLSVPLASQLRQPFLQPAVHVPCVTTSHFAIVFMMVISVMIYRVITHLENLEKSGNSKVVREKSGKMEKVRGSEIRYVFSISKYSKTRFSAPDSSGGAYDAPPEP